MFNTVVVIGPDGALLNKHRKLIPTNPERMVWGRGDASGLRVVDTPAGRIGCLICWENYMPLARFALYAQNMDILVAPTWDCGDDWLASMRHIAREGGCWVVSTGTAIQGKDVPEDFPDRDKLFASDDWLCDGGAVIVRPFGKVEAGPLNREKSIFYRRHRPRCRSSFAAFARRCRTLQPAGHLSPRSQSYADASRRISRRIDPGQSKNPAALARSPGFVSFGSDGLSSPGACSPGRPDRLAGVADDAAVAVIDRL